MYWNHFPLLFSFFFFNLCRKKIDSYTKYTITKLTTCYNSIRIKWYIKKKRFVMKWLYTSLTMQCVVHCWYIIGANTTESYICILNGMKPLHFVHCIDRLCLVAWFLLCFAFFHSFSVRSRCVYILLYACFVFYESKLCGTHQACPVFFSFCFVNIEWNDDHFWCVHHLLTYRVRVFGGHNGKYFKQHQKQ